MSGSGSTRLGAVVGTLPLVCGSGQSGCRVGVHTDLTFGVHRVPGAVFMATIVKIAGPLPIVGSVCQGAKVSPSPRVEELRILLEIVV